MRVPLIAVGLLVLLGLVGWLSGFFGGATPPAPATVSEVATTPAPAPEAAPAPAPEILSGAVVTSRRPVARRSAAPTPAPAPVSAFGNLSPAQRLDRQRYFDLREMAGYLKCPLAGTVLPADAADPAYCGGRVTRLDPRDPTTGTTYAYTRINDSQFRFCTRLDDAAGFSIPSARLFGFDPDTGCLTASIR